MEAKKVKGKWNITYKGKLYAILDEKPPKSELDKGAKILDKK